MCDYSLHGIRNRLAREDEVLVVRRFYTGSKGLASPQDLTTNSKGKGLFGFFKSMYAGPAKECAVCVPDGAILRIHGMSPKLQEAHGINSTEMVTFRQLSTEAHTYRDAMEFKNGVRLRLQELEEGQKAEILALSWEEAHTRFEEDLLATW